MGLEGHGLIPGRARDFSLPPHSVDQPWGPFSLLSNGYLGGEGWCRGPEVDHSPPFSAEVKNGGAIPPLPATPSWRGA
jgi:hypothetical protein